MNVVRAGLLTAIGLAALWIADQRWGLPDVTAPVVDPLRQAALPADAPPTVIVVVLDTVRADHTSVCGYGRPTTPVLDAMVRDGATVACRAYAPGSWTLPSHASYFTGVTVPEHGVHFVQPTDDDRKVFPGTGFFTRPLGPELPTLAEAMRDRGYQTVSVAANPLISPETGLTRGFDVVRVVNRPGVHVIRQALWDLRWTIDRDRPLFLFVNLGDAHEPWDPIPRGVGWVPPRDGLGWGGPSSPWGLDKAFPSLYPRDDRFDRLVRGELPADEKRAWLDHVTDVYDYGIWTADAAVGQLLAGVRSLGWDAPGLRAIVTSDHGEHLGEHDLGDHGRFVSEAVVRVPIVVLADPPVPLPDPVSALVVHDLARDGALPAALPDPASFELPDVEWARRLGRGGETRVAVWAGDTKLEWSKPGPPGESGAGEERAWDVVRDPAETNPVPAADPDLRARLQRALERVGQANVEGGQSNADLAKQLEAIGYTHP